MPKNPPISEEQFSKAIAACQTRENPKIAPIAREFGVLPTTLSDRVRGGLTKSEARRPYMAWNLNQEKTLISWIKSLHCAYTHPYPRLIEKAANRILNLSGEDRVVSGSWVYRFISRLPPDFHYVTQKPKEKKSSR